MDTDTIYLLAVIVLWIILIAGVLLNFRWIDKRLEKVKQNE